MALWLYSAESVIVKLAVGGSGPVRGTLDFNGLRYRQLGERTNEAEKTIRQDSFFWRGPPAVRCTLG